MADHTWTTAQPRMGVEVEVSGQEQWVIGRQRTPHVGGLQDYVDNGGGDDEDDDEQEQDQQQQEIIVQEDYDDGGLQNNEDNAMLVLQSQIQEAIEKIQTVIEDFQENFANGNVASTRHEGGTLMMHYYPSDHREYTWDEDKTIASFQSFDDLPWEIETVKQSIKIYTACEDYEDFYVGDVSVSVLSVAWYEDYAHLISVWRTYAELQWITKQEEVENLEYNKMKTIIYSDALEELLNQFQTWFEKLEALSAYKFQALPPDERYRKIVGWRLRGCMNWQVFKKAEKAKHLNKYSPTSSFDALFGTKFVAF